MKDTCTGDSRSVHHRIYRPARCIREPNHREEHHTQSSFHLILHIPSYLRDHNVRHHLHTTPSSNPTDSTNHRPMLAIGAVAERGRLGPSLIFIFIWCTLVYDPIACWTWNSRGWAYKNGVLDFAGGTVVHITSGFTSLAISLFLPKRAGFGTELVYYPAHNTTFVALGTVLMWFGWFGFNGGTVSLVGI